MESYQRLFDVIAIENLQMRPEHWMLTEVLVWSTLGQVAATARRPRARLRCSRGRCAPGSPRSPRGMTRRAGRPRPGRGGAARSPAPTVALVLIAALTASPRSSAGRTCSSPPAINLLGAWIVIRLLIAVHQQRLLVARGGLPRLRHRDPQHPRPARADHRLARPGSASASASTRISALDVLRAGVELALLLWLAVPSSRLLERRVQTRPEPDPVAPGADQQAHPLLAHRPRAGRGADQHRHRPHRLRALHRRPRRRHRLRAAEADLEPDQRAHPALRPLDQARRRRRADRSGRPARSSSSAG